MAVVYNTNVRNSRLQVVVDAIDSGGFGFLKIGTTGMALTLATITLPNPCGTVASGVLTFSGTPLNTTGLNAGTAAEAEITDSGGTIVISGLTVDTASADLIISTTSIATADIVSLLSGTITGN